MGSDPAQAVLKGTHMEEAVSFHVPFLFPTQCQLCDPTLCSWRPLLLLSPS